MLKKRAPRELAPVSHKGGRAIRQRLSAGRRSHAPIGFSRGQLSLEALISFSILLSAISLLVFSAQSLGRGLGRTAAAASEEYVLSYKALCLDEASLSTHFSVARISPFGNMSSDNKTLFSRQGLSAGEPLFFGATSSTDGFYAQQTAFEPV